MRAKRACVLGLSVPVVLAMTACGGSSAPGTQVKRTPTQQTLRGTLTVPGETWRQDAVKGQTCTAQGGYDDVRPGVAVGIKDESGTTIGASMLQRGTFASNGNRNKYDYSSGMKAPCAFRFSAPVPNDAKFYVLSLGDRGEQTYSHEQLVQRNWTVTLTLG